MPGILRSCKIKDLARRRSLILNTDSKKTASNPCGLKQPVRVTLRFSYNSIFILLPVAKKSKKKMLDKYNP